MLLLLFLLGFIGIFFGIVIIVIVIFIVVIGNVFTGIVFTGTYCFRQQYGQVAGESIVTTFISDFAVYIL